jgi:hypothetical protein
MVAANLEVNLTKALVKASTKNSAGKDLFAHQTHLQG